MHEGRIAISSPGLGQGTEVEIRLPIAPEQAAKAAAAAPSTVAARRNLRVLIVEDNLDTAEMMDLAVSQLGHVTKVAHDGATAIALATQFAPDLVFLDIGLPVMNGYTVVRALRKLPEFNNVYIAAVNGMGPGRGSSESGRSWVRQSLHQAALSGDADRSSRHGRAPHAVGPRQGERTTNPSH
jgi:CheY-like chemotaxis protein